MPHLYTIAKNRKPQSAFVHYFLNSIGYKIYIYKLCSLKSYHETKYIYDFVVCSCVKRSPDRKQPQHQYEIVSYTCVCTVFKIDSRLNFTMTVKSASIVTLWTSARVGADRIRAGGKLVTEVSLSLGTFIDILNNIK